MTEFSAQAAEVGIPNRLAWANDGPYFAALQGEIVGGVRQGPANALLAELGVALPDGAAYPAFPPRNEVLEVLQSSRPPAVALHSAVLMLDNLDRPLARAGVMAARITKGIFVGAAVLFEAAHQMTQSGVPRQNSAASSFVAGGGLLADAAGRATSRHIRSSLTALVERRYGERITMDDAELKTTVWGMLLRRLADDVRTPDDIIVRVAKRYIDSYEHSGIGDRLGPTAFTHQRAYSYAVRTGLDGSLPKIVSLLDKAQSTGAELGPNAQHVLSVVADHARASVRPKGSTLSNGSDVL